MAHEWTDDGKRGRAGQSWFGTARCRRLSLCAGIPALFALGCRTTPGSWVENGFQVGPKYTTPPAAVAEKWIDANDPRVKSVTADLAKWWQAFSDPKLDDLIATALQNNLDTMTAGARIVRARAERDVTIGNMFPQLQQLNAGYNYNQASENTGAGPPAQRIFNDWNIGATASWELDFWGKYRRAIEASDASLQASIEDYRNAIVILLSDVAATYVQIRTLQNQIMLTRANVATQTGSLKIAQTQFKEGAVTELDVSQAVSNLKQTEAQIPVLEASLRRANNRLCVLIGEPPRDLIAGLGTADVPTAPQEIALGIPADLLRRRPDVRQAERNVAVQSARIGVAESALYPSFSISGNYGWEADQFSDWFRRNSVGASFGPSIQWNFLNYGRILNTVRAQDAVFNEAVIIYQNTVLNANREVEDGLAGFLQTQIQARDLAESATAAARSVELVNVQYREGEVTFNIVFTLERFLVEQQLKLVAARGDIAINLIATYKALGGGWEAGNPDAYKLPPWGEWPKAQSNVVAPTTAPAAMQ